MRRRASPPAPHALCKSDLATQMVVELTSLQGLMVGTMRSCLARTRPWPWRSRSTICRVSLATGCPRLPPVWWSGWPFRLDTLVGLFAVGIKPSGAADPLGAAPRRWGRSCSSSKRVSLALPDALAAAAERLSVDVSEDTLREVSDFLDKRFRTYLLDSGYRYDAVDAVLAERSYNPVLARTRCAPWCAGSSGRTGGRFWTPMPVACASRGVSRPSMRWSRLLGDPAAVALYEAYRREAPPWPRPAPWTL